MKGVRGLALLFSSIALTSSSVLLGGGPLLVFRKLFGRWKYILAGLLTITPAIYFLPMVIWLPFAVTYSLVFFYQEAKLLDGSIIKSGLISVLTTVGLSCVSIGTWINFNNIDFISVVRSEINNSLTQLQSLNPNMELELDALMQQIPSILIILLTIIVWFMLLGESFLARRGAYNFDSIKPSESLKEFKVPEWAIWPSLTVLLFSFVDFGHAYLNTIAVNGLNICIVLYFFQGLAVIASYFHQSKFSLFWRCFWYLLLVFQMFPMVSILGLADYWLEFRNRMFSKTEGNFN